MELKRYKCYCKEIESVENYGKALADNFKNWEVHHRLETNTLDGERRPVDITASELKALGIYYNRPSVELIFLTKSEHNSLHHKGKTHSAETKNRMSIAKKGNKYMLGKHLSDETKKKMSEAHKGNTPNKGKHWYNNGVESKLCNECPEGFVPGRLR